MKKLLISFFAVALSVGGFAQQFNLGKVSFATDTVWTISGNGITQIWSDAVTTTGCNKTDFNGGNRNNKVFNIDCRSNPGQKGDLFSWRAVSELRNELCPYPWRVPTVQDFIDLDIALGGTGNGQNNFTWTDLGYQDNAHAIKYVNFWGGIFGGKCYSNGVNNYKGYWAFYWSQSESTVVLTESFVYNVCGFALVFARADNEDGYTNPQEGTNSGKDSGYSLRCVRDN